MHDKDPRNHPRHRERSYKPYTYTVKTIADITGLSVSAIRQGPDMSDLLSVLSYVAKSIAGKYVDVSPDDLLKSDTDRMNWGNRWPQFSCYRCAFPLCVSYMLGARGFCLKHGGGRPAMKIRSDRFYVLVDGRHGHYYESYGRLVLGLSGNSVIYLDGNTWNNRIGNLAIGNWQTTEYGLPPPAEQGLPHYALVAPALDVTCPRADCGAMAGGRCRNPETGQAMSDRVVTHVERGMSAHQAKLGTRFLRKES